MTVLEKVDPIARTTVSEQVVNKLIELIRTGNLKPGDQLPAERKLSQILQVSRPSLREALRALQIFGVLRVRHGGGVYVTSLEPGELLAPLAQLIAIDAGNADTLHEARAIIEAEVAALAATRITTEEIERLRAILELQKDLIDDPVAFRLSDSEFHHIIIEACRNPFLERIAVTYYTCGMEYRRIASESPKVLERSLTEHKNVVGALAGGDPERARSAMNRHTLSIHASTKAAMKKAKPPRKKK